jgi:hypothetical protein
MDWKHLLASITGTVDQELLLRNEEGISELLICSPGEEEETTIILCIS